MSEQTHRSPASPSLIHFLHSFTGSQSAFIPAAWITFAPLGSLALDDCAELIPLVTGGLGAFVQEDRSGLGRLEDASRPWWSRAIIAAGVRAGARNPFQGP